MSRQELVERPTAKMPASFTTGGENPCVEIGRNAAHVQQRPR